MSTPVPHPWHLDAGDARNATDWGLIDEHSWLSCDRIRWRKSTAEVDLMRQSATAAAQGLRRCMALSQPGVTEHRLAAAFGETALGCIDQIPLRHM